MSYAVLQLSDFPKGRWYLWLLAVYPRYQQLISARQSPAQALQQVIAEAETGNAVIPADLRSIIVAAANKLPLNNTQQRWLKYLDDVSRPLQDFTTEWEWLIELIALQGDTAVTPLPLQLSGSITAQAEIDVYHQTDASKDHQLAIAASQALVRFGLTGALVGGFGTGKVPLGALAGDFSGQGTLKAKLDLFFVAANNSTLAHTLPDIVVSMPDWWSLQQTLQFSQSASGPRRMQLSTLAEVKLSGELSFGRSYTRSFSNTHALAADLSVQADLGVSVNFAALQQGQFELLVERHSDGVLRLSLQRLAARERDFGLALNASLQINGADKVAARLLATLPGDAQLTEFRSKLAAWLDPYAMLQQEVATLLTQLDSTLLQQLLAVVFGLQSPEQVSALLQQRLSDLISNKLLARADVWTGDVQDIVTDSLTQLSNNWSLPPAVLQALQDAIVSKLGELRQKLATVLNELVTKLVTASQTKVLLPLAATGSQLEQAINNNSAVDLVRELNNWLTGYYQIRQNLAARISEISQKKLGLAIVSNWQSSQQQQTVTRFLIQADTPVSRILYQRCLHGQLEQLPVLLQQAQQQGSIADVWYQFDQLSKATRQVSVALDLFGLEFSWEKTVSRSLHFAVDQRGHIIAAASELQISERRKLLGERREANFASAEEWALVDGQALLNSELSFGYSYQEETLDQQDAEQFLHSLEQLALFAPGLQDRFFRLMQGPVASAQNQWRQVQINLLLDLSAPQMQRLLNTAPGAFRLALQLQIQAVQLLLPDFRRDDVARLAADYLQDESAMRTLGGKGTAQDLWQRGGEGSRKKIEPAERLIFDIARQAVQWEEFLHTLAQLRQYLQQPRELATTGQQQAYHATLQQLNERLAEAIYPWVDARDRATFDDRISWRFGALLQLICQSCGVAPADAVVLQVSMPTASGIQQTLLK
ncbi:hypothetical protein [Rheinheimera sp. F8]|uniref:hypothetical protein n=1 Tax=Rheinheimera sp. F8 TaxID=1763998 RepID=UPI0007449ACF|nr:hypothetical protein [Rheinheimera sp. F8]ALZ74924.1 hypothetical protein ATY27_03545 [Rheinheimera sp. F8]